jgi:hypothetical protein
MSNRNDSRRLTRRSKVIIEKNASLHVSHPWYADSSSSAPAAGRKANDVPRQT